MASAKKHAIKIRIVIHTKIPAKYLIIIIEIKDNVNAIRAT